MRSAARVPRRRSSQPSPPPPPKTTPGRHPLAGASPVDVLSGKVLWVSSGKRLEFYSRTNKKDMVLGSKVCGVQGPPRFALGLAELGDCNGPFTPATGVLQAPPVLAWTGPPPPPAPRPPAGGGGDCRSA